MTPKQVALVQDSFAKVALTSEAAAVLFYDRLFDIAPQMKAMFPDDMIEQRRKMMAMLAGVVKGLGSLEQVLPAASALAKRHVSYGAKAEHYPVVGAALLWTLEKGLGDGWTPEVADAWGTAYGTLSGYMISEAYGRSQAPSNERIQIMLTTTKTVTDFTSPVGVVNGIDTDAVHALIESVEAQPAKGMTHWRVASAWQGGTRSLAQVEGFMIGGASVPRHFSIDIDEPFELGGSNAYANPQEYLLAALNACMIVGYTALCALQGITLQKLEITAEGDIDLRGFFGLDPAVDAGYRELSTRVVIAGDGTKEQFQKIHELVLATSPNFYNVSRAIPVAPTLIIE